MTRNNRSSLNLFIQTDESALPGCDAALRIFDSDGEQRFYGSTRLGSVKHDEKGYLIENVDEFIGMNYELKIIDSGKVLKGIIMHQDPVENEKELTSLSIPKVIPIKGNEIK